MKKLITNSLAVVMIVAAAFYGCQDLDVQNTNNPDEARALATPGDIESLIQEADDRMYADKKGGTSERQTRRKTPAPAEETLAA